MPASAWAQEREKLREEQRDEYLRERSKLKRLEELSQGYVPPSSVTAPSEGNGDRKKVAELKLDGRPSMTADDLS